MYPLLLLSYLAEQELSSVLKTTPRHKQHAQIGYFSNHYVCLARTIKIC